MGASIFVLQHVWSRWSVAPYDVTYQEKDTQQTSTNKLQFSFTFRIVHLHVTFVQIHLIFITRYAILGMGDRQQFSEGGS